MTNYATTEYTLEFDAYVLPVYIDVYQHGRAHVYSATRSEYMDVPSAPWDVRDMFGYAANAFADSDAASACHVVDQRGVVVAIGTRDRSGINFF